MRTAVMFFGRLLFCEVVEYLNGNEVIVTLVNVAGAPVNGTQVYAFTDEIVVVG